MLPLNADLEARIADAKANPRKVDVGLLHALGCAAMSLEQGCPPMPYYAEDVRQAIRFIERTLDVKA